jgi:hypothetical protein
MMTSKHKLGSGIKMKISDIKIGKRFRKDLGNTKGFADGIKEVGGLVQPVAIDEDYNLIAGVRRNRSLQASRL